MDKPLVSVILPTFARFGSGYLQRAVSSILSQDYENFELIVIDDGSCDGTHDYLCAVAAESSNVKLIRFERNIGLPAYSVAKAITQSHGQLLSVVMDDCELRQNHLSALAGALIHNQMAGLSYGQSVFHTPGGPQVFGSETGLEQLRQSNSLSNSAVMVRRSVIDVVGCCDPHIILKRVCDWDLWLRIFRKFATHFVPEVLSDEFGPQLPDSLGRSVSLYADLVRKFMSIDRDAVLQPDNIVSGNYSFTDVPIDLDDSEKKQLSMLILEHYLATCNIHSIAQYSSALLADDTDGAKCLWQRIGRDSECENELAKAVFFAARYYFSSHTLLNNYVTELERSSVRFAAMERELELMHAEHHALKRSLSWRLTRPLRDMRALIPL